MTITESQYIDIATKISNAKNDNWLVELQGLLEYKLHKLSEEE
jgi:hypothetical protein|tara:strand:+ start:466 stop:594 length:129 start_codon:yes stop_codon:yes gene_type:complete